MQISERLRQREYSALARWATRAAWVVSLSTLSLNAHAADEVRAACINAHSEGQKLRMEGKLKAARDKLLACARPECPAMALNDCTRWLGEIQGDIPSLVIVATDANGSDVADVKVLSNGVVVAPELTGQPVLLDPGPHTLRFEREGSNPIERKIVIRVGERNRRLEVQFSPQLAASSSSAPTGEPSQDAAVDTSPGEPIPAATWVLGGIGVVGLAGFGYFALDGRSKVDDLDKCKPDCPHDDVQAARRSFLIGDISLGVGVAALAGATYFYVSSRGSSARPVSRSGLWFDVHATGRGASGLLSGRF